MSEPPIITRFTILFDPPFWVGVYEVEHDTRLSAARWVFGAEPSAEEVYLFALRDLGDLWARMTHSVPVEPCDVHPLNFKRMQREIKRAAQEQGVGTKSQEALKEQMAQNKTERRKITRQERDAHKAYKRAVSREKAKARHKGR
jgi:hypothetical protein